MRGGWLTDLAGAAPEYPKTEHAMATAYCGRGKSVMSERIL